MPIGTVKLLCGLRDTEYVDLDSFEGRPVRDQRGVVVGYATNPRLEHGCVVADVVPVVAKE